jgi:RimJ/RimL family protein N-acetyltransferase
MPWAHEGYDIEDARGFLKVAVDDWESGAAFNYAIFTAIGELVGAGSMMTRMGPGVLEIGYWIHSAHTGRGYATAAARALASLALTKPEGGLRRGRALRAAAGGTGGVRHGGDPRTAVTRVAPTGARD